MQSSGIINLDISKKDSLINAIKSKKIISGYTHKFYRYPARFSPEFASSVIDNFSNPGDLILDPFMGGGTTLVEGLVANRRVIGCDLNEVSVFVSKVKTTPLLKKEIFEIEQWSNEIDTIIDYRKSNSKLRKILNDPMTKNLNLAKSRFIKKAIAQSLYSFNKLSSINSVNFLKCGLLSTAQWALDGKKNNVTIGEFKYKLSVTIFDMVEKIQQYSKLIKSQGGISKKNLSINSGKAENLQSLNIFKKNKADLVVTSPPYPGVRMLYHRWQINGRTDTPAPYWITSTDGNMSYSHLHLGSYAQKGLDDYFENAAASFSSIRKVMKKNAYLVQLIAFKDKGKTLSRYLEMMKDTGFDEKFILDPKSNGANQRVWRDVPNRKWHAAGKGKIRASREVALFHQAI